MDSKVWRLAAAVAALSVAGMVRAVQAPGSEDRLRLHAFPMRDVTLLGGEVRDARELNRELIGSLDPERLLNPFLPVRG